jgi:hypothetical protein
LGFPGFAERDFSDGASRIMDKSGKERKDRAFLKTGPFGGRCSRQKLTEARNPAAPQPRNAAAWRTDLRVL